MELPDHNKMPTYPTFYLHEGDCIFQGVQTAGHIGAPGHDYHETASGLGFRVYRRLGSRV